MSNQFNITTTGAAFTEEEKLEVWGKAGRVWGKYSQTRLIRKDCYGNEIHWKKYGDTSSKYGWEIDHVIPKAAPHNGSDELENLQALHWKENRLKSNIYPYGPKTRRKLLKGKLSMSV